MADHAGAVHNIDGLDVPALVNWVKEQGTVHGFPLGDAFDGTEIITWPAEVLIPAALENVITADNTRDVQARIVIEGANSPTTPQAHEILLERGVTVVPDILANAGGVTVSYFEMGSERPAIQLGIRPSGQGAREGHATSLPGGQGSCTGKEHRPANSCFCTGDSTSGQGGCLSLNDALPRLLTTRES